MIRTTPAPVSVRCTVHITVRNTAFRLPSPLRRISHSPFSIFTLFTLLSLLLTANTTRADIFRWDNNQLIPGTQGIIPKPKVNLSNWNTPNHQLQYANFSLLDLSNSNFNSSDLANVDFSSSTLSFTTLLSAKITDGNFANTNLTNVLFAGADLTNANFSGAIIYRTSFISPNGFTLNQLYSTASYNNGNLGGVELVGLNLSGSNFAGKQLTHSSFYNSNLSNASFAGADVSNASMPANLTNANFSGAVINGAIFNDSTGFTASQFYSTASYINKDISYIIFQQFDMHGWDLAEQNLMNADLNASNLSGANFVNANLHFGSLALTDLTNTHLDNANLANVYGNAVRFANAYLQNTNLDSSNFSQGDFAHADLTSASMKSTNFTGANFSNAILANADMAGANLSDADLRGASNWSHVISTITSNTIYPDGVIHGINLADEALVIRNHATPITVDSSAVFNPACSLDFILESNWTSSMQFLGFTPSFAGRLYLDLAPDADIDSLTGQTFQLFILNSPLSPDNHFTTILTDPRLNWDLSNLYTLGTVTVSAVPEPTSLAVLSLVALPLLLTRRQIENTIQ